MKIRKPEIVFSGDLNLLKDLDKNLFNPIFHLDLSPIDINKIFLSIYLTPFNKDNTSESKISVPLLSLSICFFDFQNFIDFCTYISNGIISYKNNHLMIIEEDTKNNNIKISKENIPVKDIKILEECTPDNAFVFLNIFKDIFNTNYINYYNWTMFATSLLIDDIPFTIEQTKYFIPESISMPYGSLFNCLYDYNNIHGFNRNEEYKTNIEFVSENINKIKNNFEKTYIPNMLIKRGIILKGKELKEFISPTLKYECKNSKELLTAYIYNMFRINEDLIIKQCELCNKWFIPQHKNEKYCNRISNEYHDKTCKEAILLINKKKNINSDEIKILEKNVYNLVRNEIVKAKNKCFDDIENEQVKKAKKELEDFKTERDKYKKLVSQSKIPTEEYKNWLLSFYKGGKKNGNKTNR